MKHIAILVLDLVNDYSNEVLEGITNFYKDKEDVNFIISAVQTPHSLKTEYAYQYWTITDLLMSKIIDGYIIVTNSFLPDIDQKSLEAGLKKLTKKPVVSVAVPLNIPNVKYTQTACTESYYQVVKHLSEKHNRKKFAFFTGEIHGSTESDERFTAFKKALEKNNLQFYQEFVFPGDFTPGYAKEEIERRFFNKSQIQFDAIICVNDYTAGGCLLALNNLGVKVPEEVCVVGFDDSNFALFTYPTLSSINQTVPLTGAKAADVLYRLIEGEEVSKATKIDCAPVYRQSCGCVPSVYHSSAFVDKDGNYFEIDENLKQKEFNAISEKSTALSNIYSLLSYMDTRLSFDKIASTMHQSMQIAKIDQMIAFFYDKQITLFPDDDFELPEKARVLMFADKNKNFFETYGENEGPEIEVSKTIFIEGLKEKNGRKYFLTPIFLHEDNYGYLLCTSENSDLYCMSIFLKVLNNMVVHAYEYSKEQAEKRKLIENTQSLNLQSKTDELTQIFNRRGFMEYGQQLLTLSASTGKSGLVFFCDLDGLKTINDTYGHEVGDAAIVTEAQVLTAAFRNSDLVGRLSGDEFGVVAPSFSMENVDSLRERLIQLNKVYSEENELPFTLSISIGPIEFGSEDCELSELLKRADKNLYEEKKIKHAKRDKKNAKRDTKKSS